MFATTLIRPFAAQTPTLLGSVSPDRDIGNAFLSQQRLNLREDLNALLLGQRAKNIIAQDDVELPPERRKGHRHVMGVIVEPIRRIDVMTFATAEVQHFERFGYCVHIALFQQPTSRHWKSLARNCS